jgi:hypothetical protein
VDINKTLFVVTVPAIWTDEAKKFMRDAAIEVYIQFIYKMQILMYFCHFDYVGFRYMHKYDAAVSYLLSLLLSFSMVSLYH